MRRNDQGAENHHTHGKHEIHEGHETHETDRRHETGLRVSSPLGPETEEIITATIGCAIAVHKALGPGFLESIYQHAMCIELKARGLAFERERPVTVRYRGVDIRGQRIDLIVGEQVVVELKAVSKLDRIHQAQLISYLRTTGLRAGLLINFRVPILPQGLRRIVL